MFTPFVQVSEDLNATCKLLGLYAWPVLRIGRSTRTKLARGVSSQHPRLPYPQTWNHPYSLGLEALKNRHTQKRKESLFSLISGFYTRTCKSFHEEIKQNRTGREGVPGQEPRFAPRAWAAAAARRRYRSHGATAAGPDPARTPAPLSPSGGREDGGGSAPRVPRTHLSATAAAAGGEGQGRRRREERGGEG